MMFVAPIQDSLRRHDGHRRLDDLRSWVNEVRSTLPAVTHVDYSARLQTVDRSRVPSFTPLSSSSKRSPAVPVVINTSFNVRGEPIVCTPEDAYRCFMRTEIDHLVLGSFLLDKRLQPAWPVDDDWKDDFVLD